MDSFRLPFEADDGHGEALVDLEELAAQLVSWGRDEGEGLGDEPMTSKMITFTFCWAALGGQCRTLPHVSGLPALSCRQFRNMPSMGHFLVSALDYYLISGTFRRLPSGLDYYWHLSKCQHYFPKI
jgi:hypothetical protein